MEFSQKFNVFIIEQFEEGEEEIQDILYFDELEKALEFEKCFNEENKFNQFYAYLKS